MAFPTTPAFRYPAVCRLEFDTAIIAGEDGTEQRWMRHPGRASWDLSYPRLTLAERNTRIAHFEDRKGSALTFDFEFNGITYEGCYYDSDRFAASQSSQKWHSVSLRICQVTRVADSGAMPTDFPVLSTGCLVQLPYSHERNFDTVEVRTEGGRYTYSRRATVLRTWSAGGSALSDAEATAIYEMFATAQGRYRQFAFAEPDSGARVTKCRFASDTLEWRMIAPGHNSITVGIQELV